MLQKIKDLCPTAATSTIMINFERATVNAIRQSVYRQVQISGLKEQYDNDTDFALKIRFLNALAFILLKPVVEAFEELCSNDVFRHKAQNVVDYFKDAWIGCPERRSRRRRPSIFNHSMWNCFQSAAAGMPKTNNSVEGWHRSLESQISASHPSIWKVLEGI
ncbi:hypothetical protein QE152_g33060 [Popillia japonica]|uniref:MULE transposase domain-containing protein n=1 Tax=Popillia japonica TaxID=7064 RepID=A0AAW1IY94_POPJA